MSRLRPDTLLRQPLALLALLCVALLAAPGSAEAREKELPRAVEGITAKNDLTSLEGFVKKKSSTDDDINGYLNSVSDAYNNIEGPEKPTDDASPKEMKNYVRAFKRHQVRQAEFNKQAEKIILRCFDLVKLSRSKEYNLRAEVNRTAALVIGTLAPRMNRDERTRFSTELIKSLEALDAAKYEVSADRLEAGFAALGHMRREKSLEWMVENFIHTKNSDDHIVRMIAAHKAMVLFPYAETKGKLRYEIVKRMIKAYIDIETPAAHAAIAPRSYWSRVHVDVIRVLQHFAGPTASKPGGEPLKRVDEFEVWFRKHEDVRQAPWKGP